MTVQDRQRIFGSWLSEERTKAGLPSKFVANKAGINPVQLSRIEQGHSGARRLTIVNVVNAINKHSETGYQVNLNEALKRGGFAPIEEGHEDLVVINFDYENLVSKETAGNIAYLKQLLEGELRKIQESSNSKHSEPEVDKKNSLKLSKNKIFKETSDKDYTLRASRREGEKKEK